MKSTLKILAASAAMIMLTVSCGVVSFTGRKQILLFSDSEIAALSDESYAEFMSTAKVSADAAATQQLHRWSRASETEWWQRWSHTQSRRA